MMLTVIGGALEAWKHSAGCTRSIQGRFAKPMLGSTSSGASGSTNWMLWRPRSRAASGNAAVPSKTSESQYTETAFPIQPNASARTPQRRVGVGARDAARRSARDRQTAEAASGPARQNSYVRRITRVPKVYRSPRNGGFRATPCSCPWTKRTSLGIDSVRCGVSPRPRSVPL
jgi:hypothetical protein